MQTNPAMLIEAMFAARYAGDTDAVLECHHTNVVVTFNASPDNIGDGARIVGIPALVSHFQKVAASWQVLEHRHEMPKGEGLIYHVRSRISLLHRPTGEILTGHKRQIFTIYHGKIGAVEEILDRGLIQAIQRLTPRDGGCSI